MEDARLNGLQSAHDYLKQMAWLHTTPDPKEKPEKTKPSRWEQLGDSVTFPETAYKYLVDHVINMGITEAVGMGETPLSHQTIFAYQFNMGIRLEPWEVLEIRKLSASYLSQQKKSLNPAEPIPYVSEQEKAQQKRRDKATQDITNLFSKMVKS